MAKIPLGEALVRDGVISQAQLDAALRTQARDGGRLGTNLVELGFITAERLAEYLSRRFGSRVIMREADLRVDPKALALVPARVIEHYRLLPFALRGDVICVALLDPSHTPALAAVQSASKKRPEPYILPEPLLDRLLSKHAGLKAPARALSFSLGAPAATVLPLLGGPPSIGVVPVAPPIAVAPAVAHEREALFGEGVDFAEELPDIDIELQPAQALPALPTLADSKSFAQLCEVLFDAARPAMRRVLLLRKVGQALQYWAAMCEAPPRPSADFEVSLLERNLLCDALNKQQSGVQAIEQSANNERLYHELGWVPPRSAVVLPLGSWDDGLGVLYADSGAARDVSRDFRELALMTKLMADHVRRLSRG